MRKNVMHSLLTIPSVSMSTCADADLTRLTPLPQIGIQWQVQKTTLKGYSLLIPTTAYNFRMR